MKASSAATALPPLARADRDPLYRQVYERFRGAIAEGVLKPGDRIPSARALAKELGLARGTVELAYSLLGAEGYVLPRGQAGTIVAPGLHPQPRPAAMPEPGRAAAPPRTRRSPPNPLVRPGGTIMPFQMGLPALDAFPRKIWARLGARYLRGMQAADLAYPPEQGLPALRTAIAAYLQVARGIQCTPTQVFITSGYRNSLNLVVHALLQPGDRAWVEDPGYPPTRELLSYAGLEPVPVPVDAEGIMVERGVAAARRARLAVVTPAHQSPLCMSLSLPRRQALLEWASRAGAWIVEDDYDGEYRYASRPLPALKSLDQEGRVLYAGTFSKVLFPGIRLAYLVVPQALAARFDQVCKVYAGGVPGEVQGIVRDFIAEGHFARHIQRMRRLYAERRQATAEGLAAVLGARMKIEPQPGGMHLVARLAGRHADRRLAGRMREQGLYAGALSQWSTAAPEQSALLISFTNIASRRQAEELGEQILALL